MTMDLVLALPELVLVLSALGLVVLGAFSEDEGAPLVTPLAVLAILVATVVVLALDKTPQTTFGGHFIFDSYAAFLKVLIYLGSACALAVSPPFFRDGGIWRYEYAILVVMATLGMGMMVSANSLLALYMALELHSLALYVLAAFHRDSLRSSEAGLKYFVLGALATGMLLYGCSLIYGFTGTLGFTELAAILAGTGAQNGIGQSLPLGALVGVVFLIAGLAFKMAAVPFHMWTPDVYEGAPTPVTTFFSTAPKVAAIGLTVRVLMQPFGDYVADWQQVVIAISVASMVLGSFAAIGQTNIKRLMAYSSIGHMGYALIGLAAGTETGAVSVLIYIAIYMVMTLGTFCGILMMRRQGTYVEGIDDLAGLSRSRPGMALMMGVMMFSLAGIPPLAGFFGKLYVFLAAIDAGLIWLAILGVLVSVVGAFYYVRIVKIMYFDEPAELFDPAPHAVIVGVTGLTAVFIGFFVVLPGPLISAAGAAAAVLVR